MKGKGKTMKKSRFLTAIILAVLFVFTAKSQKEAMQYLLKNGAPAVVLTEVMLPDGNGIDMVKTMHQLYGKEFPIIFLTGLSDRATVQKCREVGAVDYIVKPFRPMYLLERVNIALGLQRHD